MSHSRIKSLIMFIISCTVVVFTCLFLVITNTVTLSINGFAVDRDDKIYIGTTGEIKVYEGDTQIASFSSLTSKAYAFTINKNNTILLADATNVYWMDLSGNVIEKREDPGLETFYQLQRNAKSFTSSIGDRYRIQNRLGRTQIVKNDSETVYQISILSVIVKVLFVLCGLVFIVFLIWNFNIFLKENLPISR